MRRGEAGPRWPRRACAGRASARSIAREVERAGALAGDEDGVGGQILGGEDVDVGELVAHGAVDGLDVPGRQLVELRPLAEDAVAARAGALTSRKYSRVNRFETPVIQGFEGWLTMTSNVSRALGEEVAAVAHARRDLGVLQRAVVDVVEEVRGPVDGRLQLDHLQRRDRDTG